jgi:hypothetical protein
VSDRMRNVLISMWALLNKILDINDKQCFGFDF